MISSHKYYYFSVEPHKDDKREMNLDEEEFDEVDDGKSHSR